MSGRNRHVRCVANATDPPRPGHESAPGDWNPRGDEKARARMKTDMFV